jgi:hypothetical protein
MAQHRRQLILVLWCSASEDLIFIRTFFFVTLELKRFSEKGSDLIYVRIRAIASYGGFRAGSGIQARRVPFPRGAHIPERRGKRVCKG